MDLFGWLNFDTGSAVVFLIVMLFLIIKHKKKLDFQIMLHISKIPLIYAVLWRTKFGLKFMDRFATKHRELVKLLGYCFIGFGFFGLVFISINIITMLFKLFITPKVASEGVALVLPLTNIPGLGFLSFWHFIITVFVVVLVHEFAHGIVARAHKVPVKSSGVGVFSLILPVFPLAFVEPDEKKMGKSSDVVQYSILAAGPMINIILAVLVALFSMFVMSPLENNITHPVGFSINGFTEGYGAIDSGMQAGIIVNNFNGVDVMSYQDFASEVGELAPGTELTFGSTEGESFSVVTKEHPDGSGKGYIGIEDIRNERRINDEYASFGGTFFWFKGLIKWMYFINLIIGLMNLLPLLVTDGGRMLKIAFEKIFKKKEQANKAWAFIGIVFIFTLLLAMVIKYGGGLVEALL